MTNNKKEHMTVFVSYAHDDSAYADLFIKEFEKHANLSEHFKWNTLTDKQVKPGSNWHSDIRRKVDGCDFAILLISAAFLNSKYIEKEEFEKFLNRAENERFLFFPVLLEPCDFSAWNEIEKRPYFIPHGTEYGRPWVDKLSYSDLVEFDANGMAQPNPMRPRYMSALAKSLEQKLSQHNTSSKKKKEKEKEKNKFFTVVKKSKELAIEDIMGPGKRSSVNRNFYWRRRPDDILESLLKGKRSVIIVGNTLAGKTRALYESLKKMDDTTVMVIKEKFPPPPETGEDFLITETGTGTYVAVFDDIDVFIGKNSAEDLEALILKLMEKKVVIAATCRRGNEFRVFEGMLSHHIRESLEPVYINRMSEKQVEGFNAFFTKRTKGKGELDKKAFDGNIGSYFMDLTVMADRYFKLETIIKEYGHLTIPQKLPREILTALKFFYYTQNTERKSLYSMKKIKDFCERSLLGKRSGLRAKEAPDKKRKQESDWQQQLSQFVSPAHRDEFSTVEWNDTITVLSDSDYDLNFIVPDEPYIRAEDVYLEKVVARGMKLDRIIGILQSIYRGEDLQKHGFLTSVIGFNKLINLARSSEEAYKILIKLKSLGFPPTVVTFTTLINKAKNFKDALIYFEKMKEHDMKPNEVTFNSLINKADNFKDSLHLLEKMKAHDVNPNEATFTTLFNKTKNVKDTLLLLEKMKESSMKPNAATFNSLINKAEKFNDALLFLDKMNENDIQPDETTFNTLINKADTFDNAAAFLDSIGKTGLKVDVIMLNTMITRASNSNGAFAFLEKMETLGIAPDIFTWNSLISKASGFKDIAELLKRMKAAGLSPNKHTTGILTGKLTQNPRQILEDLFQAIPPEDIFKDHLLNRIIADACKTDPACLEFVIPHTEIIAGQTDSIIIYYARMLEYTGAAPTAQKILDAVKTKTFDYYNIKANCLKSTDFDGALELYKQALEITSEKDSGQRAIVYNNTAQLIFDHKKTERYAEAAEHCNAALKLRPYNQFPYPGDLLLLFTIHLSTPETAKENVEKILQVNRINRSALAALEKKIEETEGPEKHHALFYTKES